MKQSNDQETIKTLKAEVYDLNSTIQNQNQIIMVMCQGLGVDLAQGFNMEEVMGRIKHLTENQVEVIEE